MLFVVQLLIICSDGGFTVVAQTGLANRVHAYLKSCLMYNYLYQNSQSIHRLRLASPVRASIVSNSISCPSLCKDLGNFETTSG